MLQTAALECAPESLLVLPECVSQWKFSITLKTECYCYLAGNAPGNRERSMNSTRKTDRHTFLYLTRKSPRHRGLSVARRLLAPPTGLEPVTLRLTVECSAN